jgi:hypothetical protein
MCEDTMGKKMCNSTHYLEDSSQHTMPGMLNPEGKTAILIE